MTNFKPIKDKIWETAKNDDRAGFNEQCEALMNKAAMDIWRIGWNIAPANMDEVYQMLDDASKFCHEKWIEAMNCGDAPPEDVSPGEGFLLLKNVIQDAIEGKKD